MKREPIPQYEGLYEIDEIGDVYSLDRTVLGKDGNMYPFKGRKLAKNLNSVTGYLEYSLWKKGKGTTHTGHRLVALTFIPNPNQLPVVNHLDGNKENNHVPNLEWCTTAENIAHAINTGLRVYRNRLTKSEFVHCLDSVLEGESYKELSERVPYKVPFLSTKLRKLAQELELEGTLNIALKLQHANRNKVVGSKQREAIAQYTPDGELIAKHTSLTQAARALGKNSSGTISNAINPKRPQELAYGYRWVRL